MSNRLAGCAFNLRTNAMARQTPRLPRRVAKMSANIRRAARAARRGCSWKSESLGFIKATVGSEEELPAIGCGDATNGAHSLWSLSPTSCRTTCWKCGNGKLLVGEVVDRVILLLLPLLLQPAHLHLHATKWLTTTRPTMERKVAF